MECTPWGRTGSRSGFDPLPGVVILELRGACLEGAELVGCGVRSGAGHWGTVKPGEGAFML
jgi:hypothetical protein